MLVARIATAVSSLLSVAITLSSITLVSSHGLLNVNVGSLALAALTLATTTRRQASLYRHCCITTS